MVGRVNNVKHPLPAISELACVRQLQFVYMQERFRAQRNLLAFTWTAVRLYNLSTSLDCMRKTDNDSIDFFRLLD